MQIVRFCFAHKTASMFSYRVLSAIAGAMDTAFFSANNTPPNWGASRDFLLNTRGPQVLVGPYRKYDVSPMFREAIDKGYELHDICQIRDPLDILVSQYFAQGWIQPADGRDGTALRVREGIRSGRISVNDYALLELAGETGFTSVSFPEKFAALDQPHPGASRTIVKYEDFYATYDKWVEEILTPFADKTALRQAVLALRPDYSDLKTKGRKSFYRDPLEYVEEFKIITGRHIRAVVPGDHKRFLRASEIRAIRKELTRLCPTLMSAYDSRSGGSRSGGRRKSRR